MRENFSSANNPPWLARWMDANRVALWGAADLDGFSTPPDPNGRPFAFAVSLIFPMNPQIMAGIQNGPNQAYADEYARVNQKINEISGQLAEKIVSRGYTAKPLAASVRSNPVHIRADFPHKTAATRAGLGWIGRHCQLITRPFGSWLRLGTVFTDMPLSCGPAMEKSFCGTCMKCVRACPAGALTGRTWHPGVGRDAILDAAACDNWKKKHFFAYHKGHNCGICSSVCPYSVKTLKNDRVAEFRRS